MFVAVTKDRASVLIRSNDGRCWLNNCRISMMLKSVGNDRNVVENGSSEFAWLFGHYGNYSVIGPTNSIHST